MQVDFQIEVEKELPQETHQEAGCFPDRMSFLFLPLIDMTRNNQLVRINTESRQMGTSKHPDTALVKPVNYTKDRRERLKIILRCECSGLFIQLYDLCNAQWHPGKGVGVACTII